MSFNESLPADLADHLVDLGKIVAAVAEEIDFAYLFGSVARADATPRSDIDIAVHASCSRNDCATLRLDLIQRIVRHLRTDAVDVVLLNNAPISLTGRVLTSRTVILDRRPFVRHRYESMTARMFQDFRIREHRLLAERYARG